MAERPMADSVVALTSADPDRTASALVRVDSEGAARLAQSLDRFERVWQLSSSQAAAVFGVSRQAYAKWRSGGVPAERRVDVQLADQATATLLDHVKVDRIPAVVRRTSISLGGRSLIDVAQSHDLQAVRDQVETIFDLGRVQP
jgi:hypothetical protein